MSEKSHLSHPAGASSSTVTILRLPEVKARTGLSRSTIYSLAKRGAFPSAILLAEGGRAVGWLSSDICKWLEERVSASRKEAA